MPCSCSYVLGFFIPSVRCSPFLHCSRFVDSFSRCSFPSFSRCLFLRFCFSYCIISDAFPVFRPCVTYVRRYKHVSCLSFLLSFCSSFLRFFVCLCLPFSFSHILMFRRLPLFHLFSRFSVSNYLGVVFCSIF